MSSNNRDRAALSIKARTNGAYGMELIEMLEAAGLLAPSVPAEVMEADRDILHSIIRECVGGSISTRDDAISAILAAGFKRAHSPPQGTPQSAIEAAREFLGPNAPQWVVDNLTGLLITYAASLGTRTKELPAGFVLRCNHRFEHAGFYNIQCGRGPGNADLCEVSDCPIRASSPPTDTEPVSGESTSMSGEGE